MPNQQPLDLTSCQSGQVTGERCENDTTNDTLTKIEYMPKELRASHKAAGNSGRYPSNGAIRLQVCSSCLEMIHPANE